MPIILSRKALLLTSALFLASAVPAMAQQATSGMADDIYDAADAAGFDPAVSPTILIDDASALAIGVTIGANDGNHLIEIQNGAGSVTVNSGVTASTGTTGDVIVSDDVDVNVTINGQVSNNTGSTQGALNSGALTAGQTATITVNGGAGTDGDVTGWVTGGADDDTLTLNTSGGDTLNNGQVDLGGGIDTITITGGNTAQFVGTVAAENININGTGTLNTENNITGDITFNADGVLDMTAGVVVTGDVLAGSAGTGSIKEVEAAMVASLAMSAARRMTPAPHTTATSSSRARNSAIRCRCKTASASRPICRSIRFISTPDAIPKAARAASA